LESAVQAAKEEAAAAAAARNLLQKQMEEMMVQGRLKEVSEGVIASDEL
jgi:hypothetical protein